MAIDTPRRMDNPQASQATDSALLALLSDAAHAGGLRTRADSWHGKPALRVWDPEQQSASIQVHVTDARDGSQVFAIPNGLSFGSIATLEAVVGEISRYLNAQRVSRELSRDF